MKKTLPRVRRLFLALVLLTCSSPLRADDAERVEGLTEPYRQIELAAGEPGLLAEIRVEEGSRVQAGELLARLDTSVLEQTLAIAKLRAKSVGALRAAEAELKMRQRFLRPLMELRDRGNATQREIERAEADVEVAEARVVVAKEELESQQLECNRIEAQIRRRQIHSPIDGVVSEVYREVGEAFMANDPRVVTIVQLDQLRAKFALLADQVSRLTKGQVVTVELDSGVAASDAFVETIAPVMDGKSGTVEVTIIIPNFDDKIPSGARCELLIPSGRHTTRFTSSQQEK